VNFNIYNIIIFAGILQGFFLSTTLIIQPKYRKASIYFLIATVLALSLSNLQYWILDTELNKKYPFLSTVYIQFELLIVPFFFLFVQYYLEKSLKIKILVLLFLPFVFGSLYQLIVHLQLIDNKIIDISNLIAESLSTGYNVLLIVLIYKSLYIFEKRTKAYKQTAVLMKTKWIKYILTIGLLICLIWIIINFLTAIDKKETPNSYYLLWISISFLIYCIAYAGIFHINLSAERKKIRNKIKSLTIDSHKSQNEDPTFKEFEILITKEKLFLKPSLSLELMAQKLGISSGYLSQLVNQNSDYSFNDYINRLRVDVAKEMLKNPEFNNYTIQAIGLEAGFNTKSTFYLAFKKFTDTTPSTFKKV